MTTAAVHFGIAGWSYDDWRGVVYPRNCKDTLRHVARYVDFIEINSTFYRLPEQRVAAGWIKRIADWPDFFFTAKLPREITHERHLSGQLQKAVRHALAPLTEAGRLRVVLAQFPHWFRATVENLRYLELIAEAFAGFAPLALEVRDRSWGDASALDKVAGLGMSLAHLDYPGEFDAAQTALFGPHRLAYFRLHGRNRSAWFDKKADRDAVYDWLYGQDEVAQIERRIAEIARASATAAYVVANNHFHGKAMKLLVELLADWRRERVDVPDDLLRAYPELRAIAKAAQGELF